MSDTFIFLKPEIKDVLEIFQGDIEKMKELQQEDSNQQEGIEFLANGGLVIFGYLNFLDGHPRTDEFFDYDWDDCLKLSADDHKHFIAFLSDNQFVFDEKISCILRFLCVIVKLKHKLILGPVRLDNGKVIDTELSSKQLLREANEARKKAKKSAGEFSSPLLKIPAGGKGRKGTSKMAVVGEWTDRLYDWTIKLPEIKSEEKKTLTLIALILEYSGFDKFRTEYNGSKRTELYSDYVYNRMKSLHKQRRKEIGLAAFYKFLSRLNNNRERFINECDVPAKVCRQLGITGYEKRQFTSAELIKFATSYKRYKPNFVEKGLWLSDFDSIK